MIEWVFFVGIAFAVVSICFFSSDDFEWVGVMTLVIAVILIILSFAIPSEEERYVDSFQEGYYELDTQRTIENYDGTIEDIAIELNKKEDNVVKFSKVENDWFEVTIVNETEDKTFKVYDVEDVKEMVEEGILKPQTVEPETTTIPEINETTTEAIFSITTGYYEVDTEAIIKNYDFEPKFMALELMKQNLSHVKISCIRNNAVATITAEGEDLIFVLEQEDVLKMIEEKSLILSNDINFVETTAA